MIFLDGTYITDAGQNFLLKLQTGDTMTIAEIVAGDGIPPPGTDFAALTDLINPVTRASYIDPVVIKNILMMTVVYENFADYAASTDFNLSEFGIFVIDDTGNRILLYYASLAEFPEPVPALDPANPTKMVSKRYPIKIILSASGIKVTFNLASGVFVTYDDLASSLRDIIIKINALSGFQISGIVPTYADLPDPATMPENIMYLVLADETHLDADSNPQSTVYEVIGGVWEYAGIFGGVDITNLVTKDMINMPDGVAGLDENGNLILPPNIVESIWKVGDILETGRIPDSNYWRPTNGNILLPANYPELATATNITQVRNLDTWYDRGLSANSAYLVPTFGNGVFAAINSSVATAPSNVFYSNDNGSTWQTGAISSSTPFVANSRIKYINGFWVIHSGYSQGASTNGFWYKSGTPYGTYTFVNVGAAVNGVTWGNGYWVVSVFLSGGNKRVRSCQSSGAPTTTWVETIVATTTGNALDIHFADDYFAFNSTDSADKNIYYVQSNPTNAWSSYATGQPIGAQMGIRKIDGYWTCPIYDGGSGNGIAVRSGNPNGAFSAINPSSQTSFFSAIGRIGTYWIISIKGTANTEIYILNSANPAGSYQKVYTGATTSGGQSLGIACSDNTAVVGLGLSTDNSLILSNLSAILLPIISRDLPTYIKVK